MRQFGFQVKLSLSFIGVAVLILVVTTFFIHRRAIIQQKEEVREKILGLITLASQRIDGDKHSQIEPKMESQGTPLYRQIKGVLRQIRDASSLIDSVYTMVKTDKENIWMFVVDSGNRKSGRIAYCGERYDVSQYPQMKLAFNGPVVDKEISSDRWGSWLSGYAPVYNGKGEATAMVGLHVSAASIKKMQWLLTRSFLEILVLAIISSLFMGWFISRGITRPLKILSLGAKEVGGGNLKYRVKVKTKDEIGELARTFNQMAEGLLKVQDKLQQYYLETIKSLARTLEAKDSYSRSHSERVTEYAVKIGKHLRLSDKEFKLLEDLCLLHDIGKIGMPENILSKPASLSAEEWQMIKKHPEIGEEILKPLEFLRPGLVVVSGHHERPDGKGYPRSLREGEIPLLAAIVATADAYDAMTSDRPYRPALTRDKAIAILKENAGTQFDHNVVKAFIDCLP